jgi:hypothetical protein
MRWRESANYDGLDLLGSNHHIAASHGCAGFIVQAFPSVGLWDFELATMPQYSNAMTAEKDSNEKCAVLQKRTVE